MSKKILIVDDEPMLAELLTTFLEAKGFECITKGSGNDAVKYLLKGRVDLIISDLSMPDGDGFFVLEQIKKNNISTPLAICTGSDNDSLIKDLMSSGVSACFLKPFSMKKMVSEVESLVNPI